MVAKNSDFHIMQVPFISAGPHLPTCDVNETAKEVEILISSTLLHDGSTQLVSRFWLDTDIDIEKIILSSIMIIYNIVRLLTLSMESWVSMIRYRQTVI